MERGSAYGSASGPGGAGGTWGAPEWRAPRRRRPGAARRGLADPGGRHPAGASPASGRSLRPPQPCGPGSCRAATDCSSPERRGGALRRQAKRRLRRGLTRNRNPCCAAQPASASGLRARWREGFPGLPPLAWRQPYSSPLAAPRGSCTACEAAGDLPGSLTWQIAGAGASSRPLWPRYRRNPQETLGESGSLPRKRFGRTPQPQARLDTSRPGFFKCFKIFSLT